MRLLPDTSFDPAEVHYAAVWKPQPGELAAFPNLRVIFNLGAGVDALMADRSLPDVPLVRVAVTDLTARMTEYVVLHVLMHHRQELYLRESQRAKRWAPKLQWAAGAISVGVMGLGTLGADAADALKRIGFRVAGWSRSPKHDRRRRLLSRRGAVRCVPAPHRHPGLPAAADAGDTARSQPRAVRETESQQPARRAGADQCRPRRLAERSRHPAMPRRRHARRRLARRLRHRAAARGQPRSGPTRKWC